MTALFAIDFTLVVVALFLIAYGVLRLPDRTPAPAQAEPAPQPAVSRREVIYIDIERPGHGTALREAINAGFKYSAKDGKWITLRR